MYFADAGVLSRGKPSLLAAEAASGNTSGAVSFTAQHSMLGLKTSDSAGGVIIGGVCEADFFSNTSDFDAKPRLRLAYAWFSPFNNLEVRVGQQWDLFAPLNPFMNNTNGNLWYAGNSGYRRPQFQARYAMDFAAFKQGFQFSIGDATSEDETGSGLGLDDLSKIPMIQGRMSFTFPEKLEIGAAVVYAAYEKGTAYSTKGASLDADLPFHRLLSLKGELTWGANLNNANLFSIGGNGTALKDVKSLGFFWNAISKPLDFLNVSVGFGMERVTSQLEFWQAERNLTVFGDLIFPLSRYFALSAELQMFKTTLKDAGTYSTNVIDISGAITF